MPSLAPISRIGFFFAARAIAMSDFTSAMTALPFFDCNQDEGDDALGGA
jgi:hypothetical protein